MGKQGLVPDAVMVEVRQRLKKIAKEHHVRVLWAVESGSRAWGFPSKDSDYDVRFVYAHPQEWYLAIDSDKHRDVIEIPIEDNFDINGWDLQKALRLFHKSNPPLIEWLQSPIVYVDDKVLAPRLMELAPAYYSPTSLSWHYINIAKKQDVRNLKKERVKYKAYFYALRSLLACAWVQKDLGLPPMEFATLAVRLIKDKAVIREIDDLISRKCLEPETAYGPPIKILDDYIENLFQELNPHGMGELKLPGTLEGLNAFFLEMIATPPTIPAKPIKPAKPFKRPKKSARSKA